MRLEGREPTHRLRPGGWRLAGDGGGGEVALGIAGDVRIGAVLVDPEQTAPAKVPLDAPDGALEHGADLTRLQVPQPQEGLRPRRRARRGVGGMGERGARPAK
jgi:hypothetical protein